MVRHTDGPMDLHQILKSFISGGVAGMVSKSMIAPIERVKILYLVQCITIKTRSVEFRYLSALRDLMFIVRTHGVLNLWRGNLMSVLRIFPHAAIDFAVFDLTRKTFYHKDNTLRSKIILFLCGAAAGCTSISVTTPLQFMRVRMAMERDKFSYRDYPTAFRKIYRSEGVRGFYRGYLASMIGIFVYHGTGFFVFTRIKQHIKIHYPELFKRWYVDFAVGALSSCGQFIAYPFDMVKKRMQGQALLVERQEITRMLNYKELIGQMWNQQGVRSFYKGVTVNVLKAPLSLAISWTVKNWVNRLLDQGYDL